MKMPESNSPAIRKVLVVDDHPLVRMGVSQLVNQEKDMQVCGEASTRSEGLQLAEKLTPHIALVDLSIEGGGIELLKDLKIRFPAISTLVFTMHPESTYAERALRAGARGYIMKTEVASDIVFAIRKVLNGELYLSSKLALDLIQRVATGGQVAEDLSPTHILTDRELQIFEMLGQGMKSSEIASRLNLSHKTIHAHRANIMEKLGLKDAIKLTHRAIHWFNEEITPPTSNLKPEK